jgi:hypothetical protein
VNHVRVGDAFEAKYQRQPDAQSPAGGVSSSANDMARWMALVLNGGVYDGLRIIPKSALLPAMIAEVLASPSHAIDARSGFYGYGFGVGVLPSGRVLISHSGVFDLGAATNYLLIPSLNLGIVALSNAEPMGAVEALDMEFADLVQFRVVTRNWLAAYGEEMAAMAAPVGSLVGKPPPQYPTPARPPETYIGTYYNDYFGDASVTQHDGALMLRLGPKNAEYPLQRWDGDIFTYAPSGENAPAGSISKVTFTTDVAGRATSLDIEFYQKSGRSRFARR